MAAIRYSPLFDKIQMDLDPPVGIPQALMFDVDKLEEFITAVQEYRQQLGVLTSHSVGT